MAWARTCRAETPGFRSTSPITCHRSMPVWRRTTYEGFAPLIVTCSHGQMRPPTVARSGPIGESGNTNALVLERSRMYLGPYESGNTGTARRVDDRPGRMPQG